MNVQPVPEPFLLERYFAEHEFSTPYLLGSSDCESLTVGELLALDPPSVTGLSGVWLGYTESLGSPDLRSALAGLYTTAGARDVLVHAGAQEAIYCAFRALLRPGERVVVQVPCYQSLTSIASAQGCDVARWTPDDDETAWRWSLEALDALVTQGTRVVVINSPHNPTGHQFTRSEFEAILALAERRGAFVFSDEVYRLSEIAGPPLPAACDLSESAISLGVLSKSFGLAGLRVGWLATHDRAAFDAIAAFKDYLTICNPSPSEFLATVALRAREPILARTRALFGATSPRPRRSSRVTRRRSAGCRRPRGRSRSCACANKRRRRRSVSAPLRVA